MTFLGWGGGRGKRAQYGRAVLSAPSWEAGSWFHREGQGSGLRRRVAGRAGTPGLPVAGTRGPKRLRARKHHEDQRPPGARLALAKAPGSPLRGRRARDSWRGRSSATPPTPFNSQPTRREEIISFLKI